MGYDRYDSVAALAALNALYADLRLLQNLWLPSVKLVTKTRIGSRLRRVYGPPQTPLDRVRACPTAHAATVTALTRLQATLDPFVLAARIDAQQQRLYTLANHRAGTGATSMAPLAPRPPQVVEHAPLSGPPRPPVLHPFDPRRTPGRRRHR